MVGTFKTDQLDELSQSVIFCKCEGSLGWYNDCLVCKDITRVYEILLNLNYFVD